MNESVLNALLQLFALIANVDNKDGLSFKGRNTVKTYLGQHLNIKLTNRYLKVFDSFINSEGRYQPSPQNIKNEVGEKKVRDICEHIAENLIQRDKLIVFFRLLEFINEDELMTGRELEFVKIVADNFNIRKTAYKNLKGFVSDPVSEEIEPEKLLVICSGNRTPPKNIRHIKRQGLDGRIIILHHVPTKTFIFNYTGTSLIYLNGLAVLPNRNHILDTGALITGPMISPVYYTDLLDKYYKREDQPGIKFTAKDIEFRFKNSENGIHKFSFAKESGHLVGIMGGSGVGKSTLLGVLSGKIKPDSGQILINGYDLHKDGDKLSGLIGFVPQDDLLMEELTVFQNLYLSAKLCFSESSETEILRRVNQVLSELELDDTSKLKVGSPLNKYISGGQRKRLNFALELIREPSVLFIDEPTSGLSSMDSEKVMLLLKEQALREKLIIVNIHQPFSDIFKLMDRILIMDKGGYVIYKGNPIDALKYFKHQSHYVNAEEGQCPVCGNVTPEEILRMVEVREVDEFGKLTKERKVSPREWHESYRVNIETGAKTLNPVQELPVVSTSTPSGRKQFRVFALRNLLSKFTNWQYMLINFLEAPLLAIIIGIFTRYIGDNAPGGKYILIENVNLPAYIFMAVIVAMFMGLMVSAEEIIRDRRILERESFLNLSRLSYLNSKILVLFAISAVQTLSFVLLANLILDIRGMSLAYWLVLFTTSAFANMLGLNLSSGMNSVVSIYILIPFIMVPQLLLSGVIVDFDKLNKGFRNPVYVPVIGDMMPTRWSYEALAVHQYKNNKYQTAFYDLEKEKRNASFQEYFLIPRLESLTYLGKKGMVERGIEDAVRQYNWPPYPASNDKTEYIIPYLKERKAEARHKGNSALALLDKKYEAIMKESGGKEYLQSLRLNHFNKRLDELLTNKTRINKVIEARGHLIRKADPVYMDPVGNYGRAHMYAPVKKLGSLSIDTFWFNTIIIWTGTLLLYLFLVFDGLKKAISLFQPGKPR